MPDLSEFTKYPITNNFKEDEIIGYLLIKQEFPLTIDDVFAPQAGLTEGKYIVTEFGLVKGTMYCHYLQNRDKIFGMPKVYFEKTGGIRTTLTKLLKLTRLSKPDNL